MRVTKHMTQEYFDETLFRTYFKRMYKSMFYLETDFISLLSESERDGFMVFTESVKDLAKLFKCHKKHKPAGHYNDKEFISKKKAHKITAKMVYGVGVE